MSTTVARGTVPADGVGRLLPWLVALVAGAVWTALAVHQWRHLVSPSWDLGIFTQLAQAYSRGEAPVVDIKGVGTHLLGDHWHPLLVVLAPFYRLAPSGLTLLLVQGALFALSAVPLTGVAVERLGRARGTAVGAAYALSWGLVSAAWAQFHEIALAVPLVALSLAALLRGRVRAAALWALPLVGVKEDLGLTVAALGTVLLWQGWVPVVRRPRPLAGAALVPEDRRADARRWGAVLVVWGSVWFVVTVAVLLPAFNAQSRWDYTGRLAGGGGGPLDHLVADPGTKLLTVLALVVAAGVVGAAGPIGLLAVPTLTWRFLGEVPMYWGTDWHYSAVLMPIATAALVDVTARIDARRGASRWAPVLLAGALTTATLVTGPVARLAEPEPFARTWRADAADAVLATVPAGASVASDVSLMAYLVPHAQVRWTGDPDDPAPQWVVVDRWAGGWDRPPEDATDWARARWPGTTWETALDRDGFLVARRTG